MSNTNYPTSLDDDETLPRVYDSITETGPEAINAQRDVLLAVEETLGVNPHGSAGSLADRLNVSLNPDGTLKASALASIGLITLPIDNAQIGANAAIDETKLNLDYSTSDLHTLIVANQNLIDSLNTLAVNTYNDFNLHLSGSQFLSDGSSLARHVLSQIDLNPANLSDPRDSSYIWTGLLDKDGNLRGATQAADALLQINNALVSHENATSDAHPATSIVVDTDGFQEIPLTANTVQKALDYLDDSEVLNLGQHRATQHANAIPKISRSESLLLDGYGVNVVPPTTVLAYLTHPPNTTPVDDLSVGDDIIKFNPTNTSFDFDAAFSKVRVGDIIRINYANGLESSFPIESIRYIPGSEWLVRINGANLCESVDGYAQARIDKALYDTNTYGIFAVAPACARDASAPTFTNFLSSLIVANPKSAVALGLGFDPNQINSTHYNLYLELYPTGNPLEKSITLPAIDVSGNAGATPGQYTLDSVVEATNNKLRQYGYNYRFIAFAHKGEFGIMLADAINNASFAIINGTNFSGTLATGSFTNNVLGGSSLDNFDALGFGTTGANLASPSFQSSWLDESAAQIPTKVIAPLKKRYAIVNGIKLDKFAPTYLANSDGYWDGYISDRTVVGISSVETTYTVLYNLAPSGIKAGKTIVVQPAIDFNHSLYNDTDYGRFIIKSVNFIGGCGESPSITQITVINSIHGTGSAISSSGVPTLPVKLFFGFDSVGFNDQNVIDSGITGNNYKRLHEIYLDSTGKTFSHERARFDIQNESPVLLSTLKWHILDVSPKLRGYTDGVVTTFNKYVRLYILNYDSNTGDFDGYLGQRVPSTNNIIKTGNITTGRKNVPVRFYDETNLDYIELIFKDDTVSPGVAVLSTDAPRYVDIELFPTLKTDDELFLLATCEVNWAPIAGENIIQYLTDRREFGSVDETDFTDSAHTYLATINKYLHQNGVLKGLDVDSIGTVNTGEILFKGGLALVNGKAIAVNNGSVYIPQIYPVGTSLPQDLDWAICVNEYGNFVPILLTDSETNFFGTPGSSSYYLPSTTFSELVNERKDLCVIAIANVTIASITVNTVTDVRKFLNSQDLSIPLTWTSDRQMEGNFYNFTALKTWINNFGGKNNKVILRGDFNLTDSVDLTGFSYLTIFDGIDSNITLAPSGLGKGILIGSNIELHNWKITYAPTDISYTSGYFINNGAACFYSPENSNRSNIKIINCTFSANNTTQRPPFIGFEYNAGDLLNNIVIENNNFSETNSSELGKHQAAIMFMNTNTAVGSPAVVKNVKINNNIANLNQGIYLTVLEDLLSPGTVFENVIISENQVGSIGYILGHTSSSSYNPSLIIRHNTCKIIGNVYNNGSISADLNSLEVTGGNTLIEGNKASWIRCQIESQSTERQSLLINQNILTGNNPTFYSGIFTGMENKAIYVNSLMDGYSPDVSIQNNYIDFDHSGTYGFSRGISSFVSSSILNNTIRGLDSQAIGIELNNNNSDVYRRFLVNNNKIIRADKNLTQYIYLPEDALLWTNLEGIVMHNDFDSYTIDNISEETINVIPSNWKVSHNKNQTGEVVIPWSEGRWTINAILDGYDAASNGESYVDIITSLGTPQWYSCRLHYLNLTEVVNFRYAVSLNNILPEGCRAISASVTYNPTVTPSTSSSVTIAFTTEVGVTNGTAGSAASWSPTATDTTITATANTLTGFVRYGLNTNDPNITRYLLSVRAGAQGDGSSICTMKDLTVKFRY